MRLIGVNSLFFSLSPVKRYNLSGDLFEVACWLVLNCKQSVDLQWRSRLLNPESEFVVITDLCALPKKVTTKKSSDSFVFSVIL